MEHLKRFRLTLSFLTLLDKGVVATEKDIAASWAYFFPVALILGTLASVPYFLPLPKNLQALFSLVLLVFLTRALHWDGFGDILDGVGSNAQKEKFFLVLKDSRVGIFACLGLILGLLSEYVLLQEVSSPGEIIALVLFSRLNLTPFAYFSKKLARSVGMGRIFLQGANFQNLLLNLSLSFLSVLFLTSLKTYFWAIFIHLLPSLYLYKLGQKHQGLNGDFLGAHIIWGELSFLLALLAR